LFATHANGLSIVDVADPDNPAFVATHGNTPQYNYRSLDADGRILYVTTSSPDHGFAVLDCSNPEAPVLIDQYVIGSFVRDIRVVGSLLCTTDVSHTLNVFDISNIQSGAVHRGSLSLDTGFPSRHGLAYNGSILFVTHPTGFDCVDLSDPDNPGVVGTYSTDAFPGAIDFNDGVLYLAFRGKIESVDVSDRPTPSV